ncbi:outer membrane beta-barrel protein [Caulobacter soli]|uniref:outer membrane beta-barrel protein n=1 Tax=Caulobacter soli TaxID=2708539 RepID=UPI0013EA2277|nr:outer membrane beta-barrel protein [Caulobacter soli]
MVRSLRKSGVLAGAIAAGAALVALASSAHAQAVQDRYWLQVQAFWPDINTTASVSSKNGAVGTKIDLESDLKLKDRKSLPAVFAGARIGERWSIIGEYYALNRSASASSGRDITFDDVTFPVGRTIDSAFDTDVYRLAVGYSFVRNDKADLGVAVGLHVTQFKIELEGEGRIGNASIQSQVRKRDALAPLPTLGLYGAYQATPRLTLNGRVDYLSLKVSDYDGRLVNAQVSASYRVFDNVGVGVMYRYVDYDLNIKKKLWNGELAYKFKGPAIFLEAAF